MAEFGVAIVGGGGIARVHVAAAKAMHGRIGVVAVIDPIESARQMTAQAAGAKGFATLEQFLDSPEAKKTRGVVVCTPPSVRIPIVEAALSRGMAVLSEK